MGGGEDASLLQISSSSSSSSKPSRSCCWKLPLICGGTGSLLARLLLGLKSALPSLISEMIWRSEEILFLVAVLNQFSMMPSSLSLNFSSVSIQFSCVRPTSFSFYNSSSHERCSSFSFLFYPRSSYIIIIINQERGREGRQGEWVMVGQVRLDGRRYCLLSLLIISMRYNSLRSQLNWHSKQQNHLFKKLNKPPAEKQAASEEVPPHLEPTRGNELIWLEKMMKELQQYKEEGKEGTLKQQRQGESVDAILKERCGNASRTVRMGADRPQKVAVAVEENAKSSKKIKFQIVMHSDKPPSAKKTITSEPKQKPKSAKKTPMKNTGKKSLPEKQSAGREASTSMREVPVCCPSNTKVIEVQEIKTDPYSFKETDLRILEHLWKRESENSEKEADKMSLTSKKSIGKIIRNSDKLNKTCLEAPEVKPIPSMASRESAILSNQNSTYKQYKDSRNKQSISINSFESRDLQPYNSKDLKSADPPQPISIIQQPPKETNPKPRQASKPLPKKNKAKYEKIFIKLETEKLSEYLCEKTERVEEEKERIIETNQYQKYCQTNRVEASTTNATINIPNQEYKSQTAQKLFRETELLRKDELGPRAKSQQRKFNKCAQVLKHNNYHEPEQKDNAKQDTPSSSQAFNESRTVIPENRAEIKLKRRYEYKEDAAPPAKGQKLFTLHSVSSDHSEKQLKEEPVVIIPIPQQPTEEEQPSINIELCSPSKQSQQQNESCILSQHQSAEAMDEHTLQSFYQNEQPSKDPTQQLTLLFNFLDEGHRGLLTDTNCQHQSLTEDLKLLFSAILNQIRTKKRFYNLQRFVQESKKVLEVKNEVYMHNHCKSPEYKDMVYLSLRQNVEILRRKFPLMFVKCTFTQSCSEASNLNSKKSSFNYGQSLVIDRVEIERKTPQSGQNEGPFKNCLQEKGIAEGNIIQISNKNAVSAMDNKWTRRDKENAEVAEETLRKFSKKLEDNGDLDMLQPEIYLQKKYGLMKSQEEGHSSDKMSSILQKTRGYLDNLDNYLKIR